jgi:serine phosphatase RsbU (regulator of sigma subunit)
MDQSRALERENQRLRRAVEELSVLNELATAIGASRDLQEIMHKIIRRSLRAVQAEQGTITLVEEGNQDPLRTLVRTSTSSATQRSFRPNDSLIGWILLNRKPLAVNAPLQDERFRNTPWHDSIRSILCVPMVAQGRIMGVLTLYNKKHEDGFTEEDQRLVAILAGQSAQVVENARLYQEEQELLRVQEELRLAFQIQITLLPSTTPTLDGYDIAGTSIPAQSVGGDYFDFIPVSDNRLGLCVGDVAGKGLPAAMLMANIQATVRSLALTGDPVSLLLERSNRLLCQRLQKHMFVTLFYGELDAVTHRFVYANAGHNRPYLIRAGAPPAVLTGGNLVLGFMPEHAYSEYRIDLQAGDVLCIYSDGITEAMDIAREQYGDQRLTTLLQQHAGASADAILQAVLQDVKTFTGSAPQGDDITAVVVKRVA